MRYVKTVVAAGAVALLSGAASAADIPLPPPYMPPPVQEFGGWYLRGDIGFSNQKVKDVRNSYEPYYPAGQSLTQQTSFDTAGTYQLGVGYQLNNWFRADVTGQYRGSSNFKGLDTFVNPGGVYGYDLYGGSKSEWLFLANAYVDLGTWWGITPFVGAGVGTSRVTIANFTDTGVYDGSPSWASAPKASKWNFAWAAHAGLAYRVSPNLMLELAYSYVDLGNGTTGDIVPYDGPGAFYNTMNFKHITSHDVKFGVRWMLDAAPAYYHPPLITKG